ncbi:MAG: hypothetical protein OXG81_05395 [Acidobacteria bacterium]|nr:hypothetical protein [Acidobacteriota bacterium]
MSEARSGSRTHVALRALLAVLIGILAGAALNAMLGEKGADTPALALLGGALALVVFLVQAHRRARRAPQL